MKKRVLVTGASGFIGTHLVRALLDARYDVSVVSRGSAKFAEKVTHHRLDLARASLDGIVDVDAIVHLASEIEINRSIEEPRDRIDHNLAMDLNLLEAARKSGKKPLLIFSSTDRMYGKTKKHTVTENEPPFPIEPYTASKIMSEVALQAYAHLYDIPYIVLRFDSVYGPGQPRAMFISDMIQKMLALDYVTTGPLSTKKNFVYVHDVVDAILRALKAPVSARNHAYNIGGKHASLEEVLTTLKAVFARTKKRTIRTIEEKLSLRPSKAEVAPFILSDAKARRLLKWKAKTPLYKGLQKTIEYFDL